MRRRRAALRPSALFAHEHDLEKQELFVHKTASRFGSLGGALREMDRHERSLPAHEAVLCAQLERERIVHPRAGRKRVAHEPSHPRRRHLLARRMHGDDHAFGSLFISKHFQVGIRHPFETVVEFQLAGHGDAHTGLHLIHEPRLAKARHHEHARAVHDGQLHEREARFGALELDLVYRAFDRALLTDSRRSNGFLARQIDVAPWIVGHQIAHRSNAEPLERASAPRAYQTDAPDGFVERERGCHAVRGARFSVFRQLLQPPGFSYRQRNASCTDRPRRASDHAFADEDVRVERGSVRGRGSAVPLIAEAGGTSLLDGHHEGIQRLVTAMRIDLQLVELLADASHERFEGIVGKILAR